MPILLIRTKKSSNQFLKLPSPIDLDIITLQILQSCYKYSYTCSIGKWFVYTVIGQNYLLLWPTIMFVVWGCEHAQGIIVCCYRKNKKSLRLRVLASLVGKGRIFEERDLFRERKEVFLNILLFNLSTIRLITRMIFVLERIRIHH